MIHRGRLKILYLPHPSMETCVPYRPGLAAALDNRHELKILDAGSALAPQFEGVDVVVDFGGAIGTPAMMDEAESVRLWQILGTGFEHFPLDYCHRKRIPVANCPGQFSAVALAECALMYMLMLARRWHSSQQNIRHGALHLPLGVELEGRRLALIGFGASARELAKRALAFGMKVAAIDRATISAADQRAFGLEFAGTSDDLDYLVANSDYVSLHLHLNHETRNILNAERICSMKAGAFIINVARGALVDEQALYAALAAGHLGGAGLDVFEFEPIPPDHPFLSLDNVVCTPHISGVTDGTVRRRVECAVENIERVANGLEPKYRIDSAHRTLRSAATS